MKIALPIIENKLCMHFGHCEFFKIYEVNIKAKKIDSSKLLTPPPHEPGVLPKWLCENEAELIIAGGMGSKAKTLFEASGVKVITGAPQEDPDKIVLDFLNDTLSTGKNACDH